MSILSALRRAPGEIKEGMDKGFTAGVSQVQGKIDEITAKAQRRGFEEISFTDKVFLKSIYEAMVVGGLLSYPEASQLLRYYLGWQAQKPTLRINSVIYEGASAT
jgi:hypothetical protein